MAGRGRDPIGALDALTAVAAVVFALGVIQLIAGAIDSGVTIDEPVHVERAASWLDTGWYVPENLLVAGRPDPGNDAANPYVYGPAFAAVAHLANVVVGNEAIGEVSTSADAYAVRHLTSAALAMLAALAAGAAVAFLTRSRRFGLWGGGGAAGDPRVERTGLLQPQGHPRRHRLHPDHGGAGVRTRR